MESYIKKIQIKKVRHLENLTINTGDSGFKHIIITGKNGSGKTSLLEMIRSYLELFPDSPQLESVHGVKVEFDKKFAMLQKYQKGEFILAYFSATRNVKIEIPTNVTNIQLQEKYDMEENIGRLFLNYLVYLKTQQSFARNENDMAEVEKMEDAGCSCGSDCSCCNHDCH